MAGNKEAYKFAASRIVGAVFGERPEQPLFDRLERFNNGRNQIPALEQTFPPVKAEERSQIVERTSVEEMLDVQFPGGQELFGFVGGEVGRFPQERFVHERRDGQYTFAPEINADAIWTDLVERSNGTLRSDPSNPNISLVSVQREGDTLHLATRDITYKDFRVATTPHIQELIDEGEVEPHLMLGQCQVVRGKVNGKDSVVLTWRDPKKNNYKPDAMHLIGGHHKKSEGTVFQTYLNEQRDETHIPSEAVAEIAIMGVGWDRQIQKPELVAVVDIDPAFDLNERLQKEGRGVKAFAIDDDPVAITDFVLATFPQQVPVGPAGLYAHLLVNHGEVGKREAERMVNTMREHTAVWKALAERDIDQFNEEVYWSIRTKIHYLHRAVGLPLFEDMTEIEQQQTLDWHIPSYFAVIGEELPDK